MKTLKIVLLKEKEPNTLGDEDCAEICKLVREALGTSEYQEKVVLGGLGTTESQPSSAEETVACATCGKKISSEHVYDDGCGNSICNLCFTLDVVPESTLRETLEAWIGSQAASFVDLDTCTCMSCRLWNRCPLALQPENIEGACMLLGTQIKEPSDG